MKPGTQSRALCIERAFLTHEKSMNLALKTAYWSLIVNVLLTAIKFLAGVLGHSMVMIADAVHSASDVFSTLIVLAAIKIAGRPEDEDHEYGHERFESVGAVILSLMLLTIGLGMGFNGAEILIEGSYVDAPMPGLSALLAAIGSIVVKELMYRYTRWIGESVGSDALIADAWHHRSDALSSIGSLIGIGAARFGLLFMDALSSMVICVFIVKSAVEIFLTAVNKLTDHTCGEAIELEMRRVIESIDGVLRLDILKTRQFGSKSYVDVEISVNAEMTLRAAHEIAERVHDRIEKEFIGVKHCTVHVNPFEG